MSQPSEIKTYAYKVLDCFDRLAKPELKNVVYQKVWSFIYKHVLHIIPNKPDAELRDKLFEIYSILGPLFKDAEIAIELTKAEALGSPKIPNVGQLAKIRKLTSMDEQKALELIKDLNL